MPHFVQVIHSYAPAIRPSKKLMNAEIRVSTGFPNTLREQKKLDGVALYRSWSIKNATLPLVRGKHLKMWARTLRAILNTPPPPLRGAFPCRPALEASEAEWLNGTPTIQILCHQTS